MQKWNAYKKIHSCALPDRTQTVDYNTIKDPARSSAVNQTYPYGQVGALSPESRFLIEPSWSTHDGEVCNPPANAGLPLND